MNYYNEHDPKAAAWLRELIAGGHIPAGVVDERSITEISPDELSKYTQCHFFAGIGGWSLALALAGWPATRPVWTGSCPCQPFSVAGQGKGGSDDRHLWPVFRRLVAVQRPERVFGEQVAQAIGFNWLDGISADLEEDGYAVGAVVLGAHSVGAPHIRQRLYWLADRLDGRSQNGRAEGHGENLSRNRKRKANADDMPKAEEHCSLGGMEITSNDGTRRDTGEAGGCGRESVDAGSESLRQAHGAFGTGGADSRSASGTQRVVQSRESGLEGFTGYGDDGNQPGRNRAAANGHAYSTSAWSDYDIVHCRDGKARRIESGTFPLADGVPGRVGLLRGYGNAIVPQTAAEFIMACDEILPLNAHVDAQIPAPTKPESITD